MSNSKRQSARLGQWGLNLLRLDNFAKAARDTGAGATDTPPNVQVAKHISALIAEPNVSSERGVCVDKSPSASVSSELSPSSNSQSSLSSVSGRSATSDMGSGVESQEKCSSPRQEEQPDCFATYKEEQAYLSGLHSRGNALLFPLRDDLHATHFYQGLLCWAAGQDNLKYVGELLLNQDEKYPPLSAAYNDSAAFYYAVIHEAKKVTGHFLMAGANPDSILKERVHESVYPSYQTHLDNLAARQANIQRYYVAPVVGGWKPSV